MKVNELNAMLRWSMVNVPGCCMLLLVTAPLHTVATFSIPCIHGFHSLASADRLHGQSLADREVLRLLSATGCSLHNRAGGCAIKYASWYFRIRLRL